MQQSQRDDFDRLECLEKSPPDMYKDKGGLYPKDYMGLRKYHPRALHNVHEEAVGEVFAANIKHDLDNKARAVTKNYEEHGRVFHIREERWVS